MRSTERQKQRLVARLLATATITILVFGVLLAMISILHFRG